MWKNDKYIETYTDESSPLIDYLTKYDSKMMFMLISHVLISRLITFTFDEHHGFEELNSKNRLNQCNTMWRHEICLLRSLNLMHSFRVVGSTCVVYRIVLIFRSLFSWFQNLQHENDIFIQRSLSKTSRSSNWIVNITNLDRKQSNKEWIIQKMKFNDWTCKHVVYLILFLNFPKHLKLMLANYRRYYTSIKTGNFWLCYNLTATIAQWKSEQVIIT